MNTHTKVQYNLSALTGLRFIAAFYVIIFHLDLRQPIYFLPSFIREVVASGLLGVNIFFVLSGFILTYSYMFKAPKHFNGAFYRVFLIKRIAKIFPVYLVGLLICLVLSSGNWIDHTTPKVIALNLTMTQSYVPEYSMQWYGAGSWSISTEFFFYLLFPFLLPLMLRINSPKMLFWLVIGCGLISALPGFMAHNHKELQLLAYTFPLFRISEFIAGIATGLLVFKFNKSIKPMYTYILMALSAIYIIKLGWKIHSATSYNFIFIPTIASLLVSIVTAKTNLAYKMLGSTVFTYLGKISYSLYIVQIPVLFVMEKMIADGHVSPTNYWVSFFALVISFILSAVLYHLIELPAHRLINAKIAARVSNDSSLVKTTQ